MTTEVILTDIQVTPLPQDGRTDKTLALASIVVSGFLKVDKMKIVNGSNGPFVSMPRVKNQAGEWKDIVFPITGEARKAINDQVIARYNEVLSAKGNASLSETHDNFLDDKVLAAK